MKYKINSTNQVILADLTFVQVHHAGDFTEIVEAPAAPIKPRILTHLQFRRLFTKDEREAADELEETFKTNNALTQAQKRELRSGYKDFNAASEVSLDDPGIPPMFALYEALGILTPARTAEILA